MAKCVCPLGAYSLMAGGFLLLLSFAVPWSILGDEFLPGKNIFALIVLLDVCIVSGILINAIPLPKLPPLPPLLGMLLAGVALRNIPYINVAKNIDPIWSSALRSIALAVILIKAGLELDASSLKTMKGVCLRLTAIPCLAEALTCCLFSYLILNMYWMWGLLLGFVLGAVTPAVIVPSLLKLQKEGFGVTKGIPTLVIAASSFDDVLAISGFSVILGIAFSSTSDDGDDVNGASNSTVTTNHVTNVVSSPSAGDIALLVARGPLEMIGGVLVGIALGFLLWHVPSPRQKHANRLRAVFVLGLGVVAVFGSRRIGVPGSGALIAIVAPFFAAVKWKDCKQPVSKIVGVAWTIFEPFLFGLIGAEVSFELVDGETLGYGIALLFLCLLVRSMATFASVGCAQLNLKEKIFVCIAWIPKATVQAALGPIALDTARNSNAPESVHKVARQILTITVLSILITAPLGAAAIALSGPKLLKKNTIETDDSPSRDSLAMKELNDRKVSHESSASIAEDNEGEETKNEIA